MGAVYPAKVRQHARAWHVYTLRMHCAHMHLVRLAYGARGRPPKIPGHSVLVFTIEIKRITGNRRPKAAAAEL